MWGTYWVWDARLTSVLILFFLYVGYVALHDAFDDPGWKQFIFDKAEQYRA